MEFTLSISTEFEAGGNCGQILKTGRRKGERCGRSTNIEVHGIYYCGIHQRYAPKKFVLFINEDCLQLIFAQVSEWDKYPLKITCKYWYDLVKITCKEPLVKYRASYFYPKRFLRWAFSTLPCTESSLARELDIGGNLELAEILINRGIHKVSPREFFKFIRYGAHRFDYIKRAVRIGKILIDKGNKVDENLMQYEDDYVLWEVVIYLYDTPAQYLPYC